MVAVLSAVFSNDIVCLAVAPVLIDVCRARRLNPVPFLLALACAANVGSAATLIGNPQNMLIGETLALPFAGYMREAALPVALVAAGLLMTSRRLHSHKMLGLVDWQLLVLFIGLFIVNHGLAKTGMPQDVIASLHAAGLDLTHPGPLAAAAFVLSNIVSNVPAVMLLLPAATHAIAGSVLALASTLAGNLLLVGSIANIIVISAAQQRGILIGWREHARIGVPVTLATTAIAAVCLWLRLRGA